MNPRIRAWTERLGLALMALPPLAIAVSMFLNNVDVLFLDEWDILWSVVRPYDAGTLTFADLMRRHNEHVVLTTKATELIYVLTGTTNRFYAFGVLFLTSAAVLALLLVQLRRTARSLGLEQTPWIGVAFSAFVFSVMGWENFAGGVQTQFIYANLFSIASVVCMSASRSWRALLWAFCLSVLASLSFSTGVSSFAVGALILALEPRALGDKLKAVGAWVACSVMALGVLYVSTPLPALPYGDLYDFLREPVAYASWVTSALATPLIFGDPKQALVVGGLGLVAWLSVIACAARASSRRPSVFYALVPWFAMGAYAILSLAIVGVGRIDFGPYQAMSSRYSHLAAFFWISLMTTGYLFLAMTGSNSQRRAKLNLAAAGALAAVLALIAYESSFHYQHWKQRGVALRRAVAALDRSGAGAPELSVLTPLPPHEIEQRLTLFRKYGYGPALSHSTESR